MNGTINEHYRVYLYINVRHYSLLEIFFQNYAIISSWYNHIQLIPASYLCMIYFHLYVANFFHSHSTESSIFIYVYVSGGLLYPDILGTTQIWKIRTKKKGHQNSMILKNNLKPKKNFNQNGPKKDIFAPGSATGLCSG